MSHAWGLLRIHELSRFIQDVAEVWSGLLQIWGHDDILVAGDCDTGDDEDHHHHHHDHHDHIDVVLTSMVAIERDCFLMIPPDFVSHAKYQHLAAAKRKSIASEP